jgi:hypothetical protein
MWRLRLIRRGSVATGSLPEGAMKSDKPGPAANCSLLGMRKFDKQMD